MAGRSWFALVLALALGSSLAARAAGPLGNPYGADPALLDQGQLGSQLPVQGGAIGRDGPITGGRDHQPTQQEVYDRLGLTGNLPSEEELRKRREELTEIDRDLERQRAVTLRDSAPTVP